MPPALVERLPPIWQLPSEASESGKSRSASSAAARAAASDHARLDRHGVAGRIDVADAVEARQRQDDLAAAQVGDLPADQAGIAALRHDRRPRLVGEFQDRRHLGGRAGPEHHRRPPEELVAQLDEKGRHRLALAKRVAVADDGGETVEELVVDR